MSRRHSRSSDVRDSISLTPNADFRDARYAFRAGSGNPIRCEIQGMGSHAHSDGRNWHPGILGTARRIPSKLPSHRSAWTKKNRPAPCPRRRHDLDRKLQKIPSQTQRLKSAPRRPTNQSKSPTNARGCPNPQRIRQTRHRLNRRLKAIRLQFRRPQLLLCRQSRHLLDRLPIRNPNQTLRV